MLNEEKSDGTTNGDSVVANVKNNVPEYNIENHMLTPSISSSFNIRISPRFLFSDIDRQTGFRLVLSGK